MKNKLLVISFLTVLMFTGCGKKDAEPVVSEIVEEIEEAEPVEETEPVEEAESTEEVEPTEPEETIAVEEGTALTQEELDKLNAEATTDAQKEALDAYETITKEGTWTDAYGVTYTEVVGKPDGSWRRMTDAEAEKALAKAKPGSNDAIIAQAEKDGSFVYYDTVVKKVYYDPYAFVEDSIPVIQESIERSQVDEYLSEEELRQQLGDETYEALFGGN